MCGTAAAEKKVVRVHDVREFPGHIACDGKSRSEIVVPIVVDGKVCFRATTVIFKAGRAELWIERSGN